MRFLDNWEGDWEFTINNKISSSTGHGYVVTDKSCDVERQFTIPNVYSLFNDNFGILFVASHGNPNAILLEAYYPHDAQNLADAQSRANDLNNIYRDAVFGGQNVFFAGDAGECYGVAILLTPGMDTLYHGDKSLVWVLGCEIDPYDGWEPRGATARYTYTYKVIPQNGAPHWRRFLKLLSGYPDDENEIGGVSLTPSEYRQAKNAYQHLVTCGLYGLPAQHPGADPPCLTLTPAIRSFTQETEWVRLHSADDKAQFKWTFDTLISVEAINLSDAFQTPANTWVNNIYITTESGASVLLADVHTYTHVGAGDIRIYANKIRSSEPVNEVETLHV